MEKRPRLVQEQREARLLGWAEEHSKQTDPNRDCSSALFDNLFNQLLSCRGRTGKSWIKPMKRRPLTVGRTMYGTYSSRSIVHKMDLLAEQLARRSSRWLVLITLAIALIASGCATPIGVRYVEPRVAYHSLTANVLSAERPSSFSARELMNLNLYERFNEDPEKALAEMHAGLAAKGDEDRVFALAELSFVYANDSGERSHYLASAIYAYAFLFLANTVRRRKGWIRDFDGRRIFTIRRSPVPRC